jgi:hypothetical protein
MGGASRRAPLEAQPKFFRDGVRKHQQLRINHLRPVYLRDAQFPNA